MENNMIVNSIKKLCKNNSITVSQLEKEIGLSQGLVSKWMNTTPSLDKIIDIADYFHVSLDETVGRSHNLDDEFMNKLYNQTNNKEIIWERVIENTVLYPKIRLYNVLEDEYPPQVYDEMNYAEIHYGIKYNNGYIIMYAFYKYDSILKPKVLKLFIQPTLDSCLVEQEYSQNTLLSLWIKILNNLGDNAPDEVKAEEFKNDFINNKSNSPIDSYTDEQLLQITQKMIEMEPDLPKLFEAINDPNFKKLLQILNLSSQGHENFIMAQRLSKYYEELKKMEK